MALFRHIIRISGAAIAAGLSAALIIMIMLFSRQPDPVLEMAWGWIAMAMIILMLASPVMLTAIIWSELAPIRSWWFFIIFGFFAALTGLMIISGGNVFRGMEQRDIPFLLQALFSGIIGGLAYWLVGGRHAGTWRKSEPAELFEN